MEDIGRAQLVNFDIGVGDAVNPVTDKMDPLLEGDALSWQIYPREVIVAEKLHAFISRP